jgi:predicted O-linked N-acetylglucosamine transferase (SPINDLY family)
MGVPVITKRGDRFLSHAGETIVHNAGLSDWVASDEEDYVAKAVSYASDFGRLSELRSALRGLVLASPIFDAMRFAGNFEQAMRGMWKEWLKKNER